MATIPQPDSDDLKDILKALYANPAGERASALEKFTPAQQQIVQGATQEQISEFTTGQSLLAANAIAELPDTSNLSGIPALLQNVISEQALANPDIDTTSGITPEALEAQAAQNITSNISTLPEGFSFNPADYGGGVFNPNIISAINNSLGGLGGTTLPGGFTVPSVNLGNIGQAVGDAAGDALGDAVTTTSNNTNVEQLNEDLITNPVLPDGTAFTPTPQEVLPEEQMQGVQLDPQAPTVTAQGLEAPTQQPTPQMTADQIGTATPQAQAAQGQVSTPALAAEGQAPSPLEAAQGVVPEGALAEGATAETPEGAEAAQTTLPPEAIASVPMGSLSPESIVEAAQTNLTPDMLINAAQANMTPEQTVQAIEFQASQAFNNAIEEAKSDAINFPVDPRATVREQYRQLTDFEPGEIPAWAKGAITSANQQMAARGLTSSTIAGEATTAAVLKAALPIASQDAKMFETMSLKKFDARQSATILKATHIAALDSQTNTFKMQAGLQNAQSALQINLANLNAEQQARVQNAQNLLQVALSNTGIRQQTAMANAAANLQMDLSNLDNQTKASMQNALSALNVTMANLANRQQTSLFNSEQDAQFRLANLANAQQAGLMNAQTIGNFGLQNLANRQQTALFNGEVASNFGMANLNNRQQANMMNAQNFLQMDMTNLTNAQQSAIVNAQARLQTMMSDQAAVNAARQMNITNEVQLEQFYAQLTANMDQFVATQQLDADTFNSTLINQRDQFNAKNQLLVEQSNVNYLRAINTANNELQNQANLVNSQNLLNISNQALANAVQLFRDNSSYTWNSNERALDRATSMAIAQLGATTNLTLADKEQSFAAGSSLGGMLSGVADVFDGIGSIFGGGDDSGGVYVGDQSLLGDSFDDAFDDPFFA